MHHLCSPLIRIQSPLIGTLYNLYISHTYLNWYVICFSVSRTSPLRYKCRPQSSLINSTSYWIELLICVLIIWLYNIFIDIIDTRKLNIWEVLSYRVYIPIRDAYTTSWTYQSGMVWLELSHKIFTQINVAPNWKWCIYVSVLTDSGMASYLASSDISRNSGEYMANSCFTHINQLHI